MRLSLSDSISVKSLYEYFYTPEPVRGIRPKAWKHNCPIPLMYFTLHRMAIRAQAADLAKGSYYCPECTQQSGRRVTHYRTDHIDAFKEKYCKALPILQRLQKECL